MIECVCVCVCVCVRDWWHLGDSSLKRVKPEVCLSPVSRQVLDQDNFSPIPVSTEDEYKHYTSQFPMQDPDLDKLPFPKKLPFSEFVPKVYCQLKEFIYACLKYSEDLHLSANSNQSGNSTPVVGICP
ncbi:Exocyst complex component 6B [Liparis tanakae]|uniref:Exocyst complex component 6B n=1 Tax=Liparis tanakae TaxID=230148 RepID=A0A4Z2E691_9TELE|nr:Exocyst complex component 6B [Liparis tanakae]